MSIQSLSRSQSALGAFYRRLLSCLGAQKAITATAHKLARMFYRVWTTGEPYKDYGADNYQQQYQEKMVSNLKKKAQFLVYELIAEKG